MFVLLIIGGTVVLVSYFANRPEGDPAATAALEGEVTGLREELDGVRHELSELAERLDFAEQLLAKQRESDRLAPPKP